MHKTYEGIIVTQCGPVTPYDIMDLGAWQCEAITSTDADLSSMEPWSTHLRLFSQEVSKLSIRKMEFEK